MRIVLRNAETGFDEKVKAYIVGCSRPHAPRTPCNVCDNTYT